MTEIRPFHGESAVYLENEFLRAVTLPRFGGKVASLYCKEKQFELLFQNPKSGFTPARLGDSFGEFEACGFDDAFPTIDTCEVPAGGTSVFYPDHGEIWSAPFGLSVENDRAVMTHMSRILPCRYEKVLELDGTGLLCSYKISNTWNFDFPYLWAFHCLVNYQSDMKLIFPDGVLQVENVYGSPALGKVGAVYRFPKDKTVDGAERDFTSVPTALPPSEEKFYVKGRVTEGRCGYHYPSQGVTALIEYDAAKLPYLGFWCTVGGFRGDYNCALEPASAYYDNIPTAAKNGTVSVLHAGETLCFSIRITMR